MMNIKENSLIKCNEILFFTYRVISRCYFHLPVLLFYLWIVELGMYRIIFLLAIYGLTSTFCSGLNLWLLRYFSEKKVVAMGEIAKAIGLIILLWGTRQSEVSMLWLVIAQIIGGSGFAIALATDAGLLRRIVGDNHAQFMRVQTTSQSWMFIATLLAGSTGSVLFDYNPTWPFLAAIAVSIIATICVMFIKVDTPLMVEKLESINPPLILRSDQRFWMIFYSLSRAFTLAPFIGFIPYYFIMVNVDPMLFGAVLSGFTLSAWFAAKVGNVVISGYGVKMLLFITGVFMMGAFWSIGASNMFSNYGIDYFYSGVIALILLGFGSGSIRPVTMAYLDLSSNTPDQRARIFFLMERDFGLINGGLLLFGGILLVNEGVDKLLIIFSIIYLIATSVVSIFFSNQLKH